MSAFCDVSRRCFRPRIRFLFLVLAGTALLLVPLLACAKPTPEPKVVTFAFPRQDAAYYEALLPQFAKVYPSITIKLLPQEGGALARLTSTEADVLVASFALDEKAKRGDLLDLEPWLVQDKSFKLDDFYPGLIDLYRFEGKTWAIPAGVDLYVMYYNRDLCDRYHVPYPRPGWTWDDFLSTALALRDSAAGVYGYVPLISFLDPLLAVYQHGGRLVDNWRNPTRTTFDDPLAIEALEWYARLIHKHGVSPTPEEMRQDFGGDDERAVYSGVFSGKIGLWTDMYSAQGGRNSSRKWDFNWGMVTLPRDRQLATLAQAEALVISSQAKYPDACWQWVTFLSRQVPARLAPVRRSVAESPAFERLVGVENAAVARASAENAIVIPPYTPELFGEIGQLWFQAIGAILSGQATPREAMVQAQQQVNQ